MKKKDKDSENKGPNFILNKIKRKLQEVGNSLTELSLEEVRNYLRHQSLDELSKLTENIGKQASQTLLSISAIVAELIRRSKKNKEPINVEVSYNGTIVKVEKIQHPMSEKDEKELIESLTKEIKKGAVVKYSTLKSTNSESHSEVKQTWDESQKFQQELDRLKGK